MVERSYEGEHARFYDAHPAVAERDDIEFYLDQAGSVDGPVLELACGTGRIYLELLAAGVDADGLDASGDALAQLREKAGEWGLKASVWQADMAAFEVDRAYELVICPFNAVQHLLTVDDQLAALRSAYDALAPGGEFVFDVFVPSFDIICREYGEWTSSEVTYRGDPHEFRERSRIVDEVAQQFRVENELRTPDGETVFAIEHDLVMLPERNVELLARLSPFPEWSVQGDFEDRAIRDGDAAQVWTLRK
ncbi:MAG: class I SAM-dependent methyltransferase [Halapricum sp.]